jgi:hypothetical protein
LDPGVPELLTDADGSWVIDYKVERHVS